MNKKLDEIIDCLKRIELILSYISNNQAQTYWRGSICEHDWILSTGGKVCRKCGQPY